MSWKQFSDEEQIERYARNLVFWVKRIPQIIASATDMAQFAMTTTAAMRMVERMHKMELPVKKIHKFSRELMQTFSFDADMVDRVFQVRVIRGKF